MKSFTCCRDATKELQTRVEHQNMGKSFDDVPFKLSVSERITDFLFRCNKRVYSHPLHQKQHPNCSRLARLCFCHRSTIYRIASGEQRNINQEMLDVICALAGISPCAKLDLFSTHAQEMQERQRRLEDAEEALKNGANSIGDIIDAIFFGIEQRVKELRGS